MAFLRSLYIVFCLSISINSFGLAASPSLEPLCSIGFSTSPLHISPGRVIGEKFLQIDGQRLFFHAHLYQPHRDATGSLRFGQYAGSTLHIYDLSNPTSPTTSGVIPLEYPVSVCNGCLLAAKWQKDLDLYEVTNPAAPKLLSTLPAKSPDAFHLAGDRAYVVSRMNNVDNKNRLEVWNLANPSRPIRCGNLPDVPDGSMAVSGTTAFLSDPGTRYESGHLEVIDAADPHHIQRVARIEAKAVELQPSGPLLFGRAPRFGSISIWDVRDSHHPVTLGEVLSTTADRGYVFKVSGSLLYACSPPVGIEVWDISDPTHPKLLDTVKGLRGIQGIDVRDNLIVVYQSEGWRGWLRLFRGHYPQKKVVLPPMK